MSLPLLIAKDNNAKFLKDDYKLGWIIEDADSIYWMVWGSSKDYDTAILAAKDALIRTGNHKVFVSDNPVPRECIVNKDECSFHEVDISPRIS